MPPASERTTSCKRVYYCISFCHSVRLQYKLLTGSEDRKGYNLQLRPLIVVALLGGREHCATDSMVFPLQESMNPWGTVSLSLLY